MTEDAIEKPRPKFSLMGKLRIAALVGAGIALLFVISRNWEPVSIDLILLESTMPIAVLILLTLLFGIGIGVLLAIFRPWKKKP